MDSDNLTSIRHTLAHLLASSVVELYPHAKPTIGPAIENGFYYDFDFSGGSKPGEIDLQRIEQKMREMLKKWHTLDGEIVTKEVAQKKFKDNEYKLELIDDILERNEKLTLYHSRHGQDTLFTDLCRGGHCEHPSKEIAGVGFKLYRIAGAFWRGEESNRMLTRIYGLAFPSKEELKAYEIQIEEAKKRDHKKLGIELDLFTFSTLVGAGLPLWTPHGTIVRDLLDLYVWELRKKHGYVKVEIPHITKSDLYITSGHWDKFKDELLRVTTREGHEFVMKPMNCPHHTQIYARRPWSYRELPQRYANSTMCYRDEQSGELSGLSRARAFTQDDAHVFCRMLQVKEEFLKVWDIVYDFYDTFKFDMRVRISKHDPAHPEKYLGDTANWTAAENVLSEIANERGEKVVEAIGEAAFYGPKLDFMAKDAIGREWQVATIQLDMNMPDRFDLTCTNELGEKERIVMIHAAIMGSIDRFLSILIEHTGGAFPLWLSPVQLRILPVSEVHRDACEKMFETLVASGIRCELSDSNESLGKRIRTCKVDKIPSHVVVGDKEIAGNIFTLEWRTGEKEELSSSDLVSKLVDISRSRTK